MWNHPKMITTLPKLTTTKLIRLQTLGLGEEDQDQSLDQNLDQNLGQNLDQNLWQNLEVCLGFMITINTLH